MSKRKRTNANPSSGHGHGTQPSVEEDDLPSSSHNPSSTAQELPVFEQINYEIPFIELTPQSASRLLHPNPVCLLTSLNQQNQLNVMPISWLTPANNYGGIVFVIHKSRATANNILNSKEFMLSIPNSEQRSMILACGKISGNKVNKFQNEIPGLKRKNLKFNETEKLNYNLFSVFNNDDSDSDSESKKEDKSEEIESASDGILCPIANTVAYMKCNVLQHHEGADPGHWIITSQIVEAHVHPQYWDGKCFGQISSTVPPILSFIGSQRFAFIVEENSK